MGVVDRVNAELRTIGGVPWQPWQNPYWKFNIGGPIHPSQMVTGVDSVLGLSAVYSCVRIIADSVASLPIDVYRDGANGPELVTHVQLLDNPSADLHTTLYDWVFQCMSSLLLWGNAWGLISSRTGVTSQLGLGYPQTIEWLPPEHISVQDDPQQPWNPMRARVYLQGRLMDRDEMVHVRAFTIPGRLEAVSPLRAFMMLYQQGIDALGYSADWFRNGGFPPGTFQNLAEEVDAEQAREIRRRLTDTLRLHQPLVYGKDWDYKPVVVPPSEAAFVEAMQLNATQVAAIYGVPPSKVGGRKGDSLTYANQQEETLSMITDTLRPWLVRMEHLFTSLLPKTQYVRFNTDALLKTDLKTRSDIYKTQRDMGMVTIDELRRKENMPALPGGLGNETIPLEALVRMAATTRAIPKTMVGQLTIEAQMVAELLQQMQAEGQTRPDTGPTAPSPEQYLSHILTLGRKAEGAAETATTESSLTHGFFGAKHQRCTASDRERATRWIENAARAGCLDSDERDERLYKILHKVRIRGQLDDLIKDLPPEHELAPPQEAGGEVRQADGPLFAPQALALLQGRNPALLNGSH